VTAWEHWVLLAFLFSYFKRIFAFFGKTIKKFRFSRGFVGFDKSF